MADLEPIVGRYLRLSLDGRPHRLYFEEAGTGIPLVCLHTAGADGRQFRHLLNDPAVTRHYRVLAFDMPWHGKSTPPAGWQQEEYPTNDFYNLPVQPALTPAGEPLCVELSLAGQRVRVQAWRAQVGRVPLYLLDTNLPENPPELQDISDALYGGDQKTRIRQEIVLGIGGLRALHALGLRPAVCHMNEGHSAFLALERIATLMREEKLPFAGALEVARAGNMFTTHTPVPAGFDLFPVGLVENELGDFLRESGIEGQQLLALGKEPSGAGSAAIVGAIRFDPRRILRYVVITLISTAATVGGLRLALATLLAHDFKGAEIVYGMTTILAHDPSRVVNAPPAADPSEAARPVLETIRACGVLRVGFVPERLPFAFRNAAGTLVGLDVELAHLLARDLDVDVEFVEFGPGEVIDGTSKGLCDLGIGGNPVTPRFAIATLFSQPYLDETLWFQAKAGRCPR